MLHVSKAQPLAFGYQLINECKIYSDVKARNIFYYEPTSYVLGTDNKGRPDFHLLQMRYTGTRASADNGTIKFNNILQFRIVADAMALQKVQSVRSVLQQHITDVVLKPLPVTKFESLLVYTPVQTVDSTLRMLTGGYTESSDLSSVNGSYWSERTFSIRLSDVDAQLLESALKNRQAIVSMSYAFYTTFSAQNISSFTATVNRRINRQVMQYFDSSLVNNKDSLLKNVVLKADAVDVNIDMEKWADAIQKIDINEKLPPRYPLLDVYCYDFNNDIRPDLYAKKIEIKATAVNGSEISTSSTFRHDQTDQYVRSIRFPYAVRFDRPYRFRTIEINNEGDIETSQWTERNSWSDIIDITTKKN